MMVLRGPNRSLHARLARGAVSACAAVLVALATRPAAAGEPPKLGGYWQLDLKESETLEQKLDAMRASGGMPPGGGWHGGGYGGHGGGPPMGGSGGHHGGYGGHGGGPPEGGAAHDSTRGSSMRELAHPAMSLRIEPGDDTFVLSERGRPLEVLVIGDAATAEAIQPDAPHAQSHWKGKHLVAELIGPGGGKMTQDYELTDDGNKLIVHTRLEGREGRPPLELKRVYNRANDEGDAGAVSAPELLPPTRRIRRGDRDRAARPVRRGFPGECCVKAR